ncbi:FUSC family protein [Mycobacterium sp. MYCO198283]|uniref:FUSC family protein n=1 Tax=Mycobacterium sp. MYCO198283 TaxID=2883505 RepID=UPI001E3686B8|nr:FUSC family protein [Mycobacterium sp. MYCO198283]MCG5433481.1 FUSC family protein [Mycobacterium sp. MYCO198283]
MAITVAATRRWPAVDGPAVARSLLGVLAVGAATYGWIGPAAAMLSMGAAAVAGATALQDSPRGRLGLVLGVSLQLGLAVLLALLATAHDAVFVVAVPLWCLVAGLHWALGNHAGLIATAASALVVVAPPLPIPPADAAATAVAAVAGGGLQAVLLAVWPRRRWRAQRAALTAAYESLADSATRLVADPDAAVARTPLIALREAFAHTGRQAGRRPVEFRRWYGQPERIGVTLAAVRGHPEVLTAAAAALRAIADGGHGAIADAERALQRVDALRRDSGDHDQPAIGRLSDQLHEAAALQFHGWRPVSGSLEQLRRRGVTHLIGSGLDAIVAQCTWRSPVLRHGVRLAAAAGLAAALARFGHVAYGYWIALAAVLLLRPETAHTYTRCAVRMAGALTGIAAVTVPMLVWQPGGLVAVVLAVALLGLAYAATGTGYFAVIAALSAALTLLAATSHPTDAAPYRALLAAVIGGALAVSAHVVFPDTPLTRLAQRADELLRAEVEYAVATVDSHLHRHGDAAACLRTASQRAARARSAFEAADGAMRNKTAAQRSWLRSLRVTLNTMTEACAAIERQPPVDPTVLGDEFVAAVDDYLETLSTDPLSPVEPWRLDIADLAASYQRLQDRARELPPGNAAGRILVAELGKIARALRRVSDAGPATAAAT